MRLWLLPLRLAIACTPRPADNDGGTGGGSDDITPPTIIATQPANGATDVPVSTSLTIEFSEKMDVAQLQTQVTPPGQFAAADWQFDDTVVTLQATAPLANNTPY